MRKTLQFITLVVIFIGLSSHQLFADERDPNILNTFKSLADQNELLKYEVITKSASGLDVPLLKLGKFQSGTPSVFIAANMEGNQPQHTRASLLLLKHLLEDTKKTANTNWYFLPCGNVDAFNSFFSKVKLQRNTNATPVNDDNDELVNEDGPEDLNMDKMITQMLVKHPLGEYIKDTADARIIRKADPQKGEKGIYKVYSEGIDNDNDGKYNEDGLGGVNINRNFTFDYKPFVPDHGKWAGSEPETFALHQFFAEHKDISMCIILGDDNNLISPPKEKSSNAQTKLKIPSYIADNFGLDSKKTYTPDEFMTALEDKIASKEQRKAYLRMLQNRNKPQGYQADDVKFYQSISKNFIQWLKDKEAPYEFEESGEWHDGSFEKFCYLQYGLPTFTFNCTMLPAWVKNEKNKKNTYYETQKILKYSDSLNLDLFVNWEKFQHPYLGEVEIGGFVPNVLVPQTPIKEEQLLIPLTFIAQLPQYLPKLHMSHTIKALSSNLFEVKLYIENKGDIPYPTHIGERTGQPLPVVIEYLGNAKLLEGNKRTKLGDIGAHSVKEFKFILHKTDKKGEIEFKLDSKNVITQTPAISVAL